MSYAYAYDAERNLIKKISVDIDTHDGCFEAKISKTNIPQGTYDLDFMPEYGNASAEEKGYMVAPRGGPYVKSTYMMCCFRPLYYDNRT